MSSIHLRVGPHEVARRWPNSTVGCNFILPDKFRHDFLQEGSHKNLKMTSLSTKLIEESFPNETGVVTTYQLFSSLINLLLILIH